MPTGARPSLVVHVLCQAAAGGEEAEELEIAAQCLSQAFQLDVSRIPAPPVHPSHHWRVTLHHESSEHPKPQSAIRNPRARAR